MCSPLEKGGGDADMIDFITLVGFALTIFVSGLAVGRFVEKVERFIDRHDDRKHIRNKHKNDRH